MGKKNEIGCHFGQIMSEIGDCQIHHHCHIGRIYFTFKLGFDIGTKMEEFFRNVLFVAKRVAPLENVNNF